MTASEIRKKSIR